MVSLGKVNRSDDRGFKVRDMRRRDHSPQARPCCSLFGQADMEQDTLLRGPRQV